MKNTAGWMRRRRAVGLGFVALLACLGGGALSGLHAQSYFTEAAFDADTPEAIIRHWPKASRATARAMLAKYGRPSQFDGRTLVWFNNGEWKRTIVYRKGPRHDAKAQDQDYLRQTIGYLVPSRKIAALKRFNPAIEVSPTAGEVTVRSESEAKNRLAMNLVDELVTGKRSVADARAFFDKTSRLAAAGKSSPYLNGLLFDVDNRRYMTPTGGDR